MAPTQIRVLPVAACCGASVLHISEFVSSWALGLRTFHTCFYFHDCACRVRVRLEKLPCVELSRSSNGRFKPRLDPGHGFRSEMAVAWPFQK
jgi:hypothetical protein